MSGTWELLGSHSHLLLPALLSWTSQEFWGMCVVPIETWGPYLRFYPCCLITARNTSTFYSMPVRTKPFTYTCMCLVMTSLSQSSFSLCTCQTRFLLYVPGPSRVARSHVAGLPAALSLPATHREVSEGWRSVPGATPSCAHLETKGLPTT